MASKAVGKASLRAALKALNRPKKPSKYKNIETVVDGITFPSKGEAGRYKELLLLQKAGEIGPIIRQWRYPLIIDQEGFPDGIQVGVYVADFVYTYAGASQPTVDEFKGFRTPTYRLKKKLFEALYAPLTITESGRPSKRRRRKRPST